MKAAERLLFVGSPVLAGLVLLLLVSGPAHAVRWYWSGSLSLDQKLVGLDDAKISTNAGGIVEWSMKATVELSDRVTVNGKLCTSCHGLTVDQAYGEIRFHPLLNLEVGRINVPFGEYYQRHDPANDVLASKPLPYAMGHMVRFRPDQFNLGVIPMPFSDQGASWFGDFWVGDALQTWMAVYAVNGFRSPVPRDFLFKNQVADGAFVDNNEEPSWGARVSLSQEIVSLGGSYMSGTYDPDSEYAYDIWGVDLGLLIRRVRFRAEYLERDTEVAVAEQRETLRKQGFYIQAEVPLERRVEFVARFDGLLRRGAPLGTRNDESSGVSRWTAGLNVSPLHDYVVRASYEYWRFTDFSDVRVVHLGVVVAY